MNDIEKKFELFSKKLLNEIIVINNNFLLYKHLIEKHNDRLDAMNYASAFFGMIEEALFTDVLMGLARLYENNMRKSFGNLFNYLNFIDANSKIFTVENKIRRIGNIGGLEGYIKENFTKETETILIEHKNILRDMQTKIETLRTWRDKYYAHNDSKYFLKPENFFRENPLLYEDMEDLIRKAHEIVDTHRCRFNGVTTVISYSNVFDVDEILDIVNEYHLNQLREINDLNEN